MPDSPWWLRPAARDRSPWRRCGRLTHCRTPRILLTSQSVTPWSVRMNRRLSSAALLSSSLLLMLGACSKSAPSPEPVRAVKTVVIAPTTAGSNYEYAAEIRARVESRLGFRVGGKMVERPVNVGDTVKPGQLLARLDPRDLRLGEDAARAAVTSAVVNLQQVQADFKRYGDLRDQGFISGAELERRETTL